MLGIRDYPLGYWIMTIFLFLIRKLEEKGFCFFFVPFIDFLWLFFNNGPRLLFGTP